MRSSVILNFFLIVTGCLVLTACLRIEDSQGALAAITPDPRVEGQWHATKWMDSDNPESALITLTKTEREGKTGYVFTSTNPQQQEEVKSVWGMDFDGIRFFLSEFPFEDCKACELMFYEIKDGMIYASVLKSPEAQRYLEKNYPNTSKITTEKENEWSKTLTVKTLDDETKTILKDLAAKPELWENAVILKKADE